MEFCPKCGSRLVPKKGKAGKEAALVMVCPKCGYKKRAPEMKVEPKVAKVMQPNPRQLVAVIGKEEQKLRTLPTVRIECPKCGNKEAFWILRQTRASDEPETRIFTCTKCEHRWRQY